MHSCILVRSWVASPIPCSMVGDLDLVIPIDHGLCDLIPGLPSVSSLVLVFTLNPLVSDPISSCCNGTPPLGKVGAAFRVSPPLLRAYCGMDAPIISGLSRDLSIFIFKYLSPQRGHSGQIGTAVTGTHNFFLFQKSYFIQKKNYSYATIS